MKPRDMSRVTPNGAHLYVMRNSAGLIKVGRSNNPKQRRRELELSSGQSVTLLLALENRGEDERAIHADLRSHRKHGEWFRPSKAFRLALCGFLRCDLQFPLVMEPVSQTYQPGPLHPEVIAEEMAMAMLRAGKTEEDVNEARIAMGLLPFETRDERRAQRQAASNRVTELAEEGYRRAAVRQNEPPTKGL